MKTLFVLNANGRIVSTREPGTNPGPLFSLVRGRASCAWAVRADVPEDIAIKIDTLAKQEPPVLDLRDPPIHAQRYISLLGDGSHSGLRQSAGPAFEFPDAVAQATDIVFVEDESLLQKNFKGWVSGEIAGGRLPVLAIVEGKYPISICFSARSSEVAAEAGVETVPAFRGRGFAARVTAAWALAIRASGRIPLYSTSWTNAASLAVARKLGLMAYATGWSLSD